MKKSLISLMLVVIMMVTIVTGCSTNTGNSPSGSEKPNGNQPGQSSEPLDSSGESIVTEPGALPIVTKPVKLTIGLVEDASVINYEDNYYTKYLEEKTGIDIEFYYFPSSETTQKIELMVVGNEKLPDIILNVGLGDSGKASYGSQGVILPLNNYMDNYSYFWKQSYDKYCSDTEKSLIDTLSKSPDGNIYGFPFMDVDPTDSQVESLYINHKWLEAVGMSLPTTTDELYDVLVAFRDKDPNKNGKNDEIPLVGYNSVDTRGDLIFILMNSFLYYNWSDYGRFGVENGNLSVPYIADDFREGLRFVKKII